MHPSLAHRYGLRSQEDIAVAEYIIANLKNSGWTDEQIDHAGQYYKTLVPALDRGDLTRESAIHALFDFAEMQGVGQEQRVALLEWHQSTAEYIDAHDGELPPMPRQSQAETQRQIAEIEEIMRTDLRRYQADAAMQNRYYDLLDKSRDNAPPPVANSKHLRRIEEIEEMMGDRSSPYWAPATKDALQSEYRNLLRLGAPASVLKQYAPPAPSAQSRKPSGRQAEIERLMGDRNSEYWRGPRAEQIQTEYRQLLSLAAPDGAAATSGDAGTTTQGD